LTERLPEIFYGSFSAMILDREFGSELVEGVRSGLLGDGEDDGDVGGDGRLARFRVTSTRYRAASVTTVARSMTVMAKLQVCQMLGGAAGK
jgi:hypothetical protein